MYITIRISHCEIGSGKIFPSLFPTNSTIFDYCVTHGIVSYLNRTKFNCFIWQRSVQARHCLLYDPLRFSYGIMRLTSPAKTRELPKAGMFRHKRFLLASRCYNVIGKNSFRICALIIKDVIKAAIPMKLSVGLKTVKCWSINISLSLSLSL